MIQLMGLPRVVVGHRLRAPPSLSALRLEEGKDRLPGCELEGEVRRHADREILGLMMDDDVDISEADTQEPGEHRLGDGQQRLGVDVKRARAFRWFDGVARRAIVKGRQDDEVCLPFQDLEDPRYDERVHPDRHVLAVVFKHPQRQDDRPAAVNGRANLVRQHQFVTHGASSDVARVIPAACRFRRRIGGPRPGLATEAGCRQAEPICGHGRR